MFSRDSIGLHSLQIWWVGLNESDVVALSYENFHFHCTNASVDRVLNCHWSLTIVVKWNTVSGWEITS